MEQIKHGTYSRVPHRQLNPHRQLKEYFFIRGDEVVIVYIYTNKDGKITEGGICVDRSIPSTQRLKTTLDSTMSTSWNTFMEAYRLVLGLSDDVIGMRGVLIKPEEINERLYVDDIDTIKIK